MPDTALDTKWDLRTPGQRDELVKSVWGYFKTYTKGEEYTMREVAEYVGCTMAQARIAVDALIADGKVAFEGNTRDMTYKRN